MPSGFRLAVTLPALAAACALACAACARPQGPEAAFRAFVAAASALKRDEAWALLSESSRRDVTRAWEEAKKSAGDAAPASPQIMLFSDDLRVQRRVKTVEVLSTAGDRATLRVTDDLGETREVPMVREGGGWRLELNVPNT